MDVTEMNFRFLLQGVEVGEVGDVGKIENGNFQRSKPLGILILSRTTPSSSGCGGPSGRE